MKYTKNIRSHYRKIFAFGLLMTSSYIKVTGSDGDLTTQSKTITSTGSFSNDSAYCIAIQSAPSFITLKKKDENSRHVLELNTKLFRYATKKDPLILTLKDVKYMYKDTDGSYKQKLATSTLQLAIVATAPSSFSGANADDKSGFITIEEKEDKKFIGKNKYNLILNFHNTKLQVHQLNKKSQAGSKIKDFGKLLNENKGFVRKPNSPESKYEFYFEIGEIEIAFPKKETEGNVGRLILKITAAAVVASAVGGGISYAIIKKKKKKDDA